MDGAPNAGVASAAMNDPRATLPLAVSAALILACLSSCGGLEPAPTAVPRFGTWRITELTGSITEVNTRCAVGTWTYTADLASTWNSVKVQSNGEVGYYLGFHGVPGSTFPDGYNHAGTAMGASGQITGHVVREDLGSVSDATGTYDAAGMKVDWTMEQHVGKPGECQTDVTGKGSFTAVPN